MKIALVAYLHGSGGAERQITMLANALASRCHEVHMLIVAKKNIVYPISDSVIIHDLTNEEKRYFHSIIGRYIALWKSYKMISPDVTIHYNFQSAYLTAGIPRHLYKKSIYSERGDPYDKEYSGFLGIIRKLTLFKIDGFMFQSEGARDFFDSKVKEKSIVIHNSVSPRMHEYEIPDIRDHRIVNVGRLHEQKNQKLLINAFYKIAEMFPDYTLEIYGDGNNIIKEELETLIKNLKLENRVFLYPSRKDIFDVERTASLFVLSSDFEGMPNALMEAMALGMPCISTDCRPGGARSIVVDGVNGYIVPIGNADALAEKICYVLSNPSIANQISLNAKEIINTHSEEVTFNRWADFIKNIVIR